MRGTLHKELISFQDSISEDFIKTEGSPLVIAITACVMIVAISFAVFMPGIKEYFAVQCPCIIFGLLVLACVSSVCGYKSILLGRYDIANLIQIVDIPLWSSVPIVTALLCNELVGIGLSIAAHGIMACHWAVYHRSSVIFRGIVFVPPLLLIYVVGAHPVLLIECFVFMCVALISSYASYYHGKIQTKRMRSIIHTCKKVSYDAASAKQGTHLQTIEEALAPAQTVRKFLEYAQRDEDVAILCNSLKSADKAIHCDDIEYCVCDVIALLQRKYASIFMSYTENIQNLYVSLDIGEFVLVVDLIFRALIREWHVTSIVVSGRVTNGLVALTVHCGETSAKSSIHCIEHCSEIKIVRESLRAIGGQCFITQRNGGSAIILTFPTNLH